MRLRLIPWLALFELARTVQGHLDEHLSFADRRRVAEIVRRSRGDVRKVTAREREELKTIARRLQLAKLGRELLPALGRVVRRGGGRGGLWRRR